MDHNLDDSLNLDSAMGVDFEPPGDAVVSQADISLDAGSHESNLPMEFESIEEQPMLMDAEHEQIIGYSDDHFNLQEYGVQQDEQTGANTTIVSSEQPMSHSDTMLDIQFDPQSFTSSAIKIEQQVQPRIVAVKAAIPARAPRKETVVVSGAPPPRQVAIAPKPLRPLGLKPLTLGRGAALGGAPAVTARPQLVRKVSLASLVQGAAHTQGKAVLAQIGKQLVMVPGTNQKIKLVAAPSGMSNVQYIRASQGDQAQLIATKTLSGQKPMLQKIIIQAGQSGELSNQPAVITKLAGGATRFVTVNTTQKTVPISMAGKVLVSSPSKQTVRITKKPHVVEIKSPTAKLISSSQTGGTKKVVITATPTQNVILRTTAPPKTAQISKDGSFTLHGQRTQLHQINVPGKGVQYIRLVTAGAAPRLRQAPPATVVLTDGKGNVIQMAAEKVQTGQPPPLVIPGNATCINKLARQPPQKLVRIAPVGSKPAMAATQSAPRSSQSLLAPLSPACDAPPPPAPAPAPAPAAAPAAAPASPRAAPASPPDADEVDSKAALHALLAGAGRAPGAHADADHDHHIEVDFERVQSDEEENQSNTNDTESSYKEPLEPLIVIPNYLKEQDVPPDDYNSRDDGRRYNSYEAQAFNSYQAPTTPQAVDESDLVSSELGLRPRKACNCTKSQCLKLYCDCFANGEFCHRCNCLNCHNNLENEELRQKAIRGCLDRNPNAFRPKIGKAKSGGPEIVRRHNKGCNCKRSGCLKNYCECYEAKIACTAMCKCVGCRNVEESLARRRDRRDPVLRPAALPHINFMTTEVIEAVCQCLIAAAGECGAPAAEPDPVRDVIDEFSRCLQDIITAAHHSAPMLDESRA